MGENCVPMLLLLLIAKPSSEGTLSMHVGMASYAQGNQVVGIICTIFGLWDDVVDLKLRWAKSSTDATAAPAFYEDSVRNVLRNGIAHTIQITGDERFVNLSCPPGATGLAGLKRKRRQASF